MKKTPLLSIVIILFSLAASEVAHAKLSLKGSVLLGAHGGMGTMGNSSNPNRSMSSFGLHLMPALKFGKFMIGPMAQYQFVGQMTDPAEVSDVNLGGTGYLVGAGIGFTLKRFLIRASYDFLGSNTGSVKTASGETSVYQKGTGFTGLISFRIKQNSKVLLDLYVSQTSYAEQLTGSTTNDLSSTPMKSLLYSLGLTFQLGSLDK